MILTFQAFHHLEDEDVYIEEGEQPALVHMSDVSADEKFPEEEPAEHYSTPLNAGFATANQMQKAPFFTSTPTKDQHDTQDQDMYDSQPEHAEESDSDVIEILSESEANSPDQEESYDEEEEEEADEAEEAEVGEEASDASVLESGDHQEESDVDSELGEEIEDDPNHHMQGIQASPEKQFNIPHEILQYDQFDPSDLDQLSKIAQQTINEEQLLQPPQLPSESLSAFLNAEDEIAAHKEIADALETLANSAELVEAIHVDSEEVPVVQPERDIASTGFDFGNTVTESIEKSDPAKQNCVDDSFHLGTLDTSVYFSFGQSFIHERDEPPAIVEEAVSDVMILEELEPVTKSELTNEPNVQVEESEEEEEIIPLTVPMLFPITAAAPTSQVGYSFGETFQHEEKSIGEAGRSKTTESIKSTSMFGSFGANVWATLNSEQSKAAMSRKYSEAKYEPPMAYQSEIRPRMHRAKSLPAFKIRKVQSQPAEPSQGEPIISTKSEPAVYKDVQGEAPFSDYSLSDQVVQVKVESFDIKTEPAEPAFSEADALTNLAQTALEVLAGDALLPKVVDEILNEPYVEEPETEYYESEQVEYDEGVEVSEVDELDDDDVEEVYEIEDNEVHGDEEMESQEEMDQLPQQHDESIGMDEEMGEVEYYSEEMESRSASSDDQPQVHDFIDDEAEEDSAEESEEGDVVQMQAAVSIASQQLQEQTSSEESQEESEEESEYEAQAENADVSFSEMVDPELLQQERPMSPDGSDSEDSVIFLEQTSPGRGEAESGSYDEGSGQGSEAESDEASGSENEAEEELEHEQSEDGQDHEHGHEHEHEYESENEPGQEYDEESDVSGE